MQDVIECLLRKPTAIVIARVALTCPFWMSGLSKLIWFEAGATEMARAGLEPAALYNAATVIFQLTGSFFVIAGRHVWLWAGAFGVFTGLTVLLVHRFWAIAGEPQQTIAFHTAVEHVGLIGGLLAIAALTARAAPRPDAARS